MSDFVTSPPLPLVASSYKTTIFSSGPNELDGFSCPMGIAIDDKKSVYVCDGGNNRLVKIDNNGNASVVELFVKLETISSEKSSVVPSNPLNFPEAIVFDNKKGKLNGNMYVMDGDNTIYKIKCNSGVYTPFVKIIGHYLGLAVDYSDNLYYSSLDYPSETAKEVVPRIFKVTATGLMSEFIDLRGMMVYPGGLATDRNFLYVADMGGNTVGKFDLNTGKVVDPAFIKFVPANNPTFNANISVTENFTTKSFNPYAGCQCNIAVSNDGEYIFVVAHNDGEGNNQVVYRYTSHGVLDSVISTVNAGLNGPLGVAVSDSGDVYVTNQVGGFVSVIKKKHD